jgi:Cytosolic carboxypeptidase N-terminal domain
VIGSDSTQQVVAYIGLRCLRLQRKDVIEVVQVQNELVYDCDSPPGRVSFGDESFSAAQWHDEDWWDLQHHGDNTLIFDSRYQSCVWLQSTTINTLLRNTCSALTTSMLMLSCVHQDRGSTHCRFESGNLRRAIRVFSHEYDLVLRNDINTSGHAQWFYFSVRNLQKGAVYKLNLINLVKPDSLYAHGMQPLFHSKQRAAQTVRDTSFIHDR